MKGKLMAEEVLFDNEFFRAVKNSYQTDSGLVVEKGLSWKQSPDKTIEELNRLYKLDKACKNMN